MASSRKNRSLFIDCEAVSALTLVKAGLLDPITGLMNSSQMNEVIQSGQYNNKTFPFPFILAPGGKVNEQILKSASSGEKFDLVNNDTIVGSITAEEIFKIDPKERVRQLYGTDDLRHPGVEATTKRLGNYAISGEYTISTENIDNTKKILKDAIEKSNARHVTAIMMSANPLHRAHERLIRQSLEQTDLVVIFLLKPYDTSDLHFDLRHEVIDYFIKHFLPQNRVVIIPLENSYIFAGSNEVIIDAIVAENYGCDRLVIGQNHAGVGMYYDQNANRSVIDRIVGIDIEIRITPEYVYCNECTTLVSTRTCPHGQHHHISYHSESILELMRLGILPPAVLMRREVSAKILAKLFPDRFKNLEKLYYDIMPVDGLIEEQSERDFYLELMQLYQTTSLT
jgi:sulfate adenylyltransferase